MKQIEVQKDILSANETIALENRELFTRHGIFVLNLMSSPGAGKTTLLERTIDLLKDTCRERGVAREAVRATLARPFRREPGRGEGTLVLEGPAVERFPYDQWKQLPSRHHHQGHAPDSQDGWEE